VDTGERLITDRASNFATERPMVGQRVGGVNVFGGGLALYN
jgi:hypothetical protein